MPGRSCLRTNLNLDAARAPLPGIRINGILTSCLSCLNRTTPIGRRRSSRHCQWPKSAPYVALHSRSVILTSVSSTKSPRIMAGMCPASQRPDYALLAASSVGLLITTSTDFIGAPVLQAETLSCLCIPLKPMWLCMTVWCLNLF